MDSQPPRPYESLEELETTWRTWMIGDAAIERVYATAREYFALAAKSLEPAAWGYRCANGEVYGLNVRSEAAAQAEVAELNRTAGASVDELRFPRTVIPLYALARIAPNAGEFKREFRPEREEVNG